MRIYPTEEQKQLIDTTFDCCRYVWNGFLALKTQRYQDFKENINFNKMSSILTQIKKADDFLTKVDSMALQQELKYLSHAFDKWFKHVKKNGVTFSSEVRKKANRQNRTLNIYDSEAYPKFKKKADSRNSYRTMSAYIKEDKVFIPKVGLVESIITREPTGIIKGSTISKTPTGKYFISFTVEETVEKLPMTEKEIGIDLGLKTFAVGSDGSEFHLDKKIWKYLKRIDKLQRKLYKKPNRKTKSYKKLKLKIAKLHERVVNFRTDFLHKLSTKLISENQVIYLETLDIKNMTKDKYRSRAILNSAWSTFVTMIKNKATIYGREVVQIDKYFPSSKKCSSCGNEQSMPVHIRTYKCPCCGMILDRDLNAAINIHVQGKLIRGQGSPLATLVA